MSPETFVATIATYRDRRPFKPFTVELVSGRRIEIDFPEAVIVREGVAAALLPGGVPVVFDWEGVAGILGDPAGAREDEGGPIPGGGGR